MLTAVIGQFLVSVNADTKPELKNLRTGRVLVNIDNPETHHAQYHTADFERSNLNFYL